MVGTQQLAAIMGLVGWAHVPAPLLLEAPNAMGLSVPAMVHTGFQGTPKTSLQVEKCAGVPSLLEVSVGKTTETALTSSFFLPKIKVYLHVCDEVSISKGLNDKSLNSEAAVVCI